LFYSIILKELSIFGLWTADIISRHTESGLQLLASYITIKCTIIASCIWIGGRVESPAYPKWVQACATHFWSLDREDSICVYTHVHISSPTTFKWIENIWGTRNYWM